MFRLLATILGGEKLSQMGHIDIGQSPLQYTALLV
jgi:hypothetical protein